MIHIDNSRPPAPLAYLHIPTPMVRNLSSSTIYSFIYFIVQFQCSCIAVPELFTHVLMG